MEHGASTVRLRPSAVCGVMLAASLLSAACALHGHRIDFTPLERANRIEVRAMPDDTLVKTITDPEQIRQAVEFIERYQTGWKDPITGNPVPEFMLTFHRNEQGIGGFGVGRGGGGYITSDPPTAGFWSRAVPAVDLAQLLQMLGLPPDAGR